MVATSILAIILLAVLTAYMFVGRNLSKLVNRHRQEAESRLTLRQFSDDLSAALKLTTATAAQVSLVKPTASGNTTVSYAFSSADGTLTRTEGGATRAVLSGVTALSVSYYNEGGSTVAGSPQSVKFVELMFSTASGSEANGTRATYTTVSPRVLLRNKPMLQ